MRTIDSNVFGRIWAITGNVGNGKNTLAMELIVLMSHRCAHGVSLKEPCPFCSKYGIEDRRLHVFANFDITESFIKERNIVFVRLYNWKDFLKIRKGSFHQLWLIDEPNTWLFDSRNSMSEQNKKTTGKLQRCRHYNADAVLITQLSSMVDLRGRRLISLGIFAVTPSTRVFNYAIIEDNEIIPIFMRKSYCKKALFGNFTTDNVDEESEVIE